MFYKLKEPYGIFSNFADTPIVLKGFVWPTVEHYFQAQKFLDPHNQREIRECDSPWKAAKMGRERTRPLREDWEDVKDSIMRLALITKFRQHAGARSLLKSTQDAIIIERTENDSYWADGGDGSGKNMLGKLLMSVREELSGELTHSEQVEVF